MKIVGEVFVFCKHCNRTLQTPEEINTQAETLIAKAIERGTFEKGLVSSTTWRIICSECGYTTYLVTIIRKEGEEKYSIVIKGFDTSAEQEKFKRMCVS